MLCHNAKKISHCSNVSEHRMQNDVVVCGDGIVGRSRIMDGSCMDVRRVLNRIRIISIQVSFP